MRAPPNKPGVSCLSKHFGNTVRQFREERSWSQEMLAEQADLNRSYVGELERGQAIASLITLEKLASAFGVSLSHLLSHTENIAKSKTANTFELTSIAC